MESSRFRSNAKMNQSELTSMKLTPVCDDQAREKNRLRGQQADASHTGSGSATQEGAVRTPPFRSALHRLLRPLGENLRWRGGGAPSWPQLHPGTLLLSPSSAPRERQILLFLFFLLLYLMILVGNAAIVWVVSMHSALHSPMYFFLCSLSLLEICYTSVVVPLMLSNIFGGQKPIPVAGCRAQMFLFVTFGSTDCFFLAIMAYDNYVAICHLLHYSLIMTQRLWLGMVAGSVGLALFLSLQLTTLIFSLPFCGRHRKINHFLCDVPLILQLACVDIRVQQAMLYVVGILVLTVPFLLICVSYGFITAAILCIWSSEGQ
ncbi:Olfactory receptor 10Q1 [Heterocephalus glaber]|uniref:Olfactory receptor 10Q1 n=1 Tax=Heterocephalus glaber TaxID=10181 RepID=G5AMQ0_HETGA|nr:Olfactory receptor 10Q1 [Heterocephalus glaber]